MPHVRRTWITAALVLGGAALAPPVVARWGTPPSAPATYTAFGLRLFGQLSAAGGGSNLFVSPASAGIAFSLAATGATGATRAELARALGVPDSAESIARQNAALLAALDARDVELRVATSVWVRNDVTLAPEFERRARDAFRAQVSSADFASPATPRRMNAWVSAATAGRIRSVVGDQIPPELQVVLLNAVYFKGRWMDAFNARATAPRPFHLPGGRVRSVPTMRRHGSYAYAALPGMRALRIPYRDGRFAMVVVLPDSGVPLARTVRELTTERWAVLVRSFHSTDVDLALPRFTARTALELIAPMQALGVRQAFDSERAELGAMLAGGPRLFISEARQSVFVKVDEEGTEAAASTWIGIGPTSVPPPPVPFIVDRPFLAAIVDQTTGALLFVGQVYDPRDADPES